MRRLRSPCVIAPAVLAMSSRGRNPRRSIHRDIAPSLAETPALTKIMKRRRSSSVTVTSVSGVDGGHAKLPIGGHRVLVVAVAKRAV